MSLAEGATLMGRSWAESLMTSACTITRTVKGELNETTMLYENTQHVVYAGPCRMRFVAAIVREADVQGQSLARQEGVLSLPITGSGGVVPDDLVTIDSNPLDPDQVGKTVVIRGGHEQTFSTARRYPVELVS